MQESSSVERKDQPKSTPTASAHRERFRERMVGVGFVAGTQTAYLREFDRFEAALDRKNGSGVVPVLGNGGIFCLLTSASNG